MKQILIAEDQEQERRRLVGYLHAYALERGQEITCMDYPDGSDLLEEYHGGADLILLDIDMVFLDGIETARRIRSFDEQVQIVFITRVVSHALEGYEVQAADYLVKPVSYELFCTKMDRIFRKMEHDQDEMITVRTGSGQRFVRIHEIVFAETSGRRVILHLPESRRAGVKLQDSDGHLPGQFVETSMPLYQLEKQLEGKSFFRCHSAFLINLCCVTGYTQTDVLLGEIRVPLSKHRRKAFMEALTLYHTNRM